MSAHLPQNHEKNEKNTEMFYKEHIIFSFWYCRYFLRTCLLHYYREFAKIKIKGNDLMANLGGKGAVILCIEEFWQYSGEEQPFSNSVPLASK